MLFSIIICIDFKFLGDSWILFLVATLVAFVHMDWKKNYLVDESF